MTKKRHITAVCIALVLCFVLVFALAACKDKNKPGGDDNTGGTTTPPTQDDTVRPYFTELSTALANSISADLVNGFNVGFTGSVTLGTDNYSFDLDANVLPKAADANKNFRLEVKQNDTLKFGLYNDQANLYLTAYGYDGVKYNYNFSNASVMQALRAFLVINVPNYEGLPNLSDIDISGSSLKDTVRDLLPIGLAVLATDPNAEDPDASLRVAKEGNTYTLKLFLGNLQQALPAVDLSALSGIVIDLKATVENNVVKGLSFGLSMNETAYAIAVESKNAGLFGPLNAELDAAVPQDLLETPAASVIQTDFSGKINISKTDDAGNASVVKSADWKLVSKIDLFTLIENNFMFSALPQDNFFHFQVSHTCDDTCKDYCAANLASAKSQFTTPGRYKNTSIVDIAWNPSTMGTNNLLVDIALFDLITNDALDKLASAAAGISIQSLSDVATMMIASQLTFNVDLDAVMLQDNTIPLVDPPVVQPPVEPTPDPEPTPSFDFKQILDTISGIVNLNGGALNLDVAALKTAVTALAGEAPVIGSLNISNIISLITDSASGYSFTVDDNSFGHRADVADYNTYEKAVKYNVDGVTLKMAPSDAIGATPYGGFDGANTLILGSPALYTKSVETSGENVLNVYAKQADGMFVLISDAETPLSYYEIDQAGGLQNLFFKYTYLDFNKAEKTAFGSIFGFRGLNLKNSGTQSVTLLASLMMGESLNTTIEKNLAPLLANFGTSADTIPNIETIIPIAADAFDVKLNYINETSTALAFEKGANNKAEYNVNETVNTSAAVVSKVGDKTVETVSSITGAVTVPKDALGMLVPGTYEVTYTIPDSVDLTFEDGTKTLTEQIVVKAYTSVTFAPGTTVEYRQGTSVVTGGTAVLGMASYNLESGPAIETAVQWEDIYSLIKFEKDGTPVENVTTTGDKLIFPESGAYKASVVVSEGFSIEWDINVIAISSVAVDADSLPKLIAGKNDIKGKLITLKLTYSDNAVKNVDVMWSDVFEDAAFEIKKTDDNATTGIVREAAALTLPAGDGVSYTLASEFYGFVYSANVTTGTPTGGIVAEANTALFIWMGKNWLSGQAIINLVQNYDNGVKIVVTPVIWDHTKFTITKPDGTELAAEYLTESYFELPDVGTYTFKVNVDGTDYTVQYTAT